VNDPENDPRLDPDTATVTLCAGVFFTFLLTRLGLSHIFTSPVVSMVVSTVNLHTFAATCFSLQSNAHFFTKLIFFIFYFGSVSGQDRIYSC